ncbi:MAG: SOS response-associated peptidase [Opitutaceae bacterium]|nr:SOS response-associated peptidase [Opitutaceae bacterium]
MCGRYRLTDPAALRELAHRAPGIELPEGILPRFNVAPSQAMPVIAAGPDGAPRMMTMKWGYIPFWEKSAKPKLAPINAKSEEAFAKPMFQQSIQQRRCLIPADGFYEWKTPERGGKQPFDIHLPGNRPFFLAGIYEKSTDIKPETFLIFTTRPNRLMERIHQRMPVILADEATRSWITPGPVTSDQFTRLMVPYPPERMEALPITSLVNNPRNDNPAILAPSGPDQG